LKNLIEVNDQAKSYGGIRAVDQVSLKIPNGGEYTGKLSNNALSGNLKQGGMEFALNVTGVSYLRPVRLADTVCSF
jgi:ABC-type branched-subunit amino acid transport system ATPase component